MKETITLENKYFSTDLFEQWTQFINPKSYNWIDFHFIKIYFDVSRHMGTWDVEFYLLGLGLRVYGVYNQNTFKKKIDYFNKIVEEDGLIPVR